MGRRTTPGTGQLSAEITLELLAAFKAYARGRGERVRTALERAMEREMGNPPPKVTHPPLPPMPVPRKQPDPPPAAPRKPGRGKK